MASFRWVDLDFNLESTFRSAIQRWPGFVSSYLAVSTPRWFPRSIRWWGLAPRSFPLRWPNLDFELDFSIVDDVVWSVVTAVESVALVSMLCFFFVFCGCTV